MATTTARVDHRDHEDGHVGRDRDRALGIARFLRIDDRGLEADKAQDRKGEDGTTPLSNRLAGDSVSKVRSPPAGFAKSAKPKMRRIAISASRRTASILPLTSTPSSPVKATIA
jgi:hypothetical protein